MKVSIIMSAYNSGAFISKAIESVLNQTYKNIELVIINDCSTDNTEEVIQSFNDNRIKYKKLQKNEGCGAARDEGIKISTGDYITFLDSDDYYNLDCIEKLVEEVNKSHTDIVSHGIIYHKLNGDIMEHIPNKCTFRITKKDGNNPIKLFSESHKFSYFLSLNLINRKLFDRVNYYRVRYVEDTPTFVNLLCVAKSRSHIPYAGYNYVERKGSLTNSSYEIRDKIYSILGSIYNLEFMYENNIPIYDIFRGALDLSISELFKMLSKQDYNKEVPELLITMLNKYNRVLKTIHKI